VSPEEEFSVALPLRPEHPAVASNATAIRTAAVLFGLTTVLSELTPIGQPIVIGREARPCTEFESDTRAD
jgi:hypothetical protein